MLAENTHIKRLILSIPLTMGWIIYTGQANIGNIVLGYIFSFAVLLAVGFRGENFALKNIPRQTVNLVIYVLRLGYEVLISGLTVTRLTLTPSLPIKPDMAKVKTQDETRNPVISAISAHGITITPGELVVDFEENEEEGVIMIVHSLHMDQSVHTLDSDQTTRLEQIKGILGL